MINAVNVRHFTDFFFTLTCNLSLSSVRVLTSLTLFKVGPYKEFLMLYFHDALTRGLNVTQSNRKHTLLIISTTVDH